MMRRSLACLVGLLATHCAPTATVARAYGGRVSIEPPTSVGTYRDAFEKAMLANNPTSHIRAQEKWLRGEGARPTIDEEPGLDTQYVWTRDAIGFGPAADVEGQVFAIARARTKLAEQLAYERVRKGVPSSMLLRQMALAHVARTGAAPLIPFVSAAGIPISTTLQQLFCRGDEDLGARIAHELGLALSDYDVECSHSVRLP